MMDALKRRKAAVRFCFRLHPQGSASIKSWMGWLDGLIIFVLLNVFPFTVAVVAEKVEKSFLCPENIHHEATINNVLYWINRTKAFPPLLVEKSWVKLKLCWVINVFVERVTFYTVFHLQVFENILSWKSFAFQKIAQQP